MKIFIFGASGLLGSKLMRFGSKEFEMIGADLHDSLKSKSYNTFALDATKRNDVIRTVKKYKPEVVINAINIPSVDFCEENKEAARNIIVDVTKNILNACKNDTKFVFLSSDYIFDGKNGPYREDANPNPTSQYGLLKLEAERFVRNAGSNNLVVRTTILYGWHDIGKPNFVLWTIDQLKSGNKISIVTDQYGNPTLADNLAEIILNLIKNGKSGVYNVVGKDYVNRFDFAKKIAKVFGLDSKLVIPITSDVLRQKTLRGPKLGLKIDKLMKELQIKTVGIDEGLKRMKEEMMSNG